MTVLLFICSSKVSFHYLLCLSVCNWTFLYL
jgi:hypothetical protein